MTLKSFKFALALGILNLASVNAQVQNLSAADRQYLELSSYRVIEIKKDILNQEVPLDVQTKSYKNSDLSTLPGMPNKMGMVALNQVGAVLAVGQGIVALGEGLYSLVQRGKPSTRTSYAPVSILPRTSAKTYADIFDTENWKSPIKKTYQVVYTNGFGMDVVRFRYIVIHAYGGTYKGKGAYITAAQIIPESVMTMFGFEFTASMKLAKIENAGTNANPIAVAQLKLNYTVETIITSSNEELTYYINGKGLSKEL